MRRLVGFGQILDEGVRVADDAVDRVGGFRADRGHLVALRHDPVLARRRNHDRGRELLAEHVERRVDLADVDHHAPAQRDAAVGLEVAEQRRVVFRAAGGVVHHRLADVLRGDGHDLVDVHRLHHLRAVLGREGRPRCPWHELLRRERARAGEHRQRAEKLAAAAAAQPLVAAHQAQRRLTRIDRLLRITFDGGSIAWPFTSPLCVRRFPVSVGDTDSANGTLSPTWLTACRPSTPAG